LNILCRGCAEQLCLLPLLQRRHTTAIALHPSQGYVLGSCSYTIRKGQNQTPQLYQLKRGSKQEAFLFFVKEDKRYTESEILSGFGHTLIRQYQCLFLIRRGLQEHYRKSTWLKVAT